MKVLVSKDAVVVVIILCNYGPFLSLAFLRALRPRTIHTTGHALRNTVGAVPHLRQWRLKVDTGEMKLKTQTSAGNNVAHISQ